MRFALPLLALLVACNNDPSKDKSAAVVNEPAAAEAPAPAPVAAPVAAPIEGAALTGTIGFTGAKVTGKHDGVFQSWKGGAVVKDGALSSIQVTADTASLKTDAEKLDGHLKSPDFFDVAKFPTASFKSSAITAGAPADTKLAGATHTVTGDLTLMGVTKSITVPAKVEIGADGSVKALAEFFINRKDFNIVYPGKPDDLIKDEVAIRIDVSAAGGAAPAAAPAAH